MNVRSRAALLLVSTLVLVLRAPASRAQTVMEALVPSSSVVDSTPQAKPVGPTRDALAVGVRTTVRTATAPAVRNGAGLGQSEALMIVGGAAFLVGAIVEGDAGKVFMIGGAIIGLYGLYKYLQ